MAEKPGIRLRLDISNTGEEGWRISPRLDNDVFLAGPCFLVMGTFPLIRWGWISEQIARSILGLEGDESREEEEYYLNQLNRESTEVEKQMQSAINSTWTTLLEIVNSFTTIDSVHLSSKQALEKIGELMMRIEKAHEPINQAWPAWKKFLQDNPDYESGEGLTWEEFQDSRSE
jgi:hypothetical protein